MKVFDVLYKRAENDGVGLWSKCGVMLEKDNGKQSLKFDVLPVSSEWDGWLVVSARKAKDYDQDGRVELSVEEEPPF